MTDQEIIVLYKQKGQEEKAFTELLQVYQERLYWHIRRMVTNHDDADDVLQNTFVKIWKALPKFRGDSGLFTWIYRIASNEALSFLNQRKKRLALRMDDPDQVVVNQLEGDEYFDGDYVQKKLYAVIETLPAKQKIVFQMKYFDEMKYQDISEILDTSVGALKASYHHAVKKIEQAFKED
ncbi:MAG: sigma-70 family RNA polymerase sigma factor [Bacteroidales bacterium]|nr:sigma-70 family RNA polymerase sigma factor [Bacteroidales bacterium]